MADIARSLAISGSFSHALSSTLRKQALEESELLEVFTVEEAVNKMGFGVFQLIVALLAGFVWVVEAFEVMILSILSAAVKCDWDLSSVEEATITTVVFLGFLFGSPTWGFAADRFGRKKVLGVVLLTVFTFGMISAFAPNFPCLLLFRGLVGFGAGGIFLAPAYCLEFLPAKSRAVTFCLLEIAWAGGAILEALLALTVMTKFPSEHPWRWLLGFSAIPLLFPLTVLVFMPESPRYLIYKGEEDKAKKVLTLVAKINCSRLIPGRLVTQEVKENILKEQSYIAASSALVESSFYEDRRSTQNAVYGTTLAGDEASPHEDKEFTDDYPIIDKSDKSQTYSVSDCNKCSWSYMKKLIVNKLVSYYHWKLILFKNGWWRTTMLLWYLWFAGNVMYYGGILLTTSLFQNDEHCGLKSGEGNTTVCRRLSSQDYVDIVWTTCAEFPGAVWVIFLLLVLGRKKSMAVNTFLAACCLNLLFICASKTVLTVFLFGVRCFGTAYFQSIGLYTAEVYPTAIRAFGVALCSSAGRIGGMIAPYIAQTLLAYNSYAAIGTLIGISVLSSLTALLLPIETKGRPMKDSGG
ncbi:synaptic vesicle 2-related protein-like isoform X2 [Dysidea avara]|uniref:synaptic vesicle 2-related protein-like isoform X2 n=1 Tax=Dysidea avara TaxID=196820 RepID=UPI0033307E74